MEFREAAITEPYDSLEEAREALFEAGDADGAALADAQVAAAGVGMDSQAAELAKEAYETNKGILEIIREQKILSEEQIEDLLASMQIGLHKKHKLAEIDDEQAVEILKIIQRDEVGHVEIGTRWFRYLCEQRKLEPEKTFQDLLSQYMKGNIKGPLDREARRQAGFTEAELDYLEEGHL